jgi:hypothetical protein
MGRWRTLKKTSCEGKSSFQQNQAVANHEPDPLLICLRSVRRGLSSLLGRVALIGQILPAPFRQSAYQLHHCET